jgi:hypothetical protein
MLIDHGDGVWTATDEMKFPGLVWLPLRMTVVRMQSGALWVHSPVRFDAGLADEIAALGPVRWIVGPNCLHHLHLGTWAARFPDAELWGAPGLAQKRCDLRFAGTLGSGHEPWRSDLDTLLIEGSPKIGEVVFFHRASKTLVVTDLLFNVLHTRGFGTPWVLRMMGTHRKLAMSRAWRFGIRDRHALAESGRRVLALDPQRLVVAHGEVITELAPDALAQALAWMINVPKALATAA